MHVKLKCSLYHEQRTPSGHLGGRLGVHEACSVLGHGWPRHVWVLITRLKSWLFAEFGINFSFSETFWQIQIITRFLTVPYYQESWVCSLPWLAGASCHPGNHMVCIFFKLIICIFPSLYLLLITNSLLSLFCCYCKLVTFSTFQFNRRIFIFTLTILITVFSIGAANLVSLLPSPSFLPGL